MAKSKQGILLLRLVRSYLELDMFASLLVHTETTLAAGEAELLVFEGLVQVWDILFLFRRTH